MTSLRSHQEILQALSELIRGAVGIEVFVVDEEMVAIAGTGAYRRNVGTKRPRDSYVNNTIISGDGHVIMDPRYTDQCYRCEYRDRCPYTKVICSPILLDREVKGLFGLLGFTDLQRNVMLKKSSFLEEMTRKLASFAQVCIDADMSSMSQFLGHPKTRMFIDTFEQGIVLTSPENVVLNLNEKAEQLLQPRKNWKAPSEKLQLSDILGMEWLAGAARPRSGEPPFDAHGHVFPINEGRTLGGNLVILADRKNPAPRRKSGSFAMDGEPDIVGVSPPILRLKEQASLVAAGNSTILITGETGTGKELIARSIHAMSKRRTGPFVAINCAAIPDSLLESELFGYQPGAFTGADKHGKDGKFQMAHEGTIFLDEVGRLSLPNQSKILRILEGSFLEKLGGGRAERYDVRVLAATNVDLETAVKEHRFLPDLYYRLAVIPLQVPPLRSRVGDIPLLIRHFTRKFGEMMPEQDFLGFDPQTFSYLMSHAWPGNVRELSNVVEYAVNLIRGRQVSIADLPPYLLPADSSDFFDAAARSSPKIIPIVEQFLIKQTLDRFGMTTEGKRRTANYLGISMSTLYRRLAEIADIEGADQCDRLQ